MVISVNCKYICKRGFLLHLHPALQEIKGQRLMCAVHKQRKPFSNNTLLLKYMKFRKLWTEGFRTALVPCSTTPSTYTGLLFYLTIYIPQTVWSDGKQNSVCRNSSLPWSRGRRVSVQFAAVNARCNSLYLNRRMKIFSFGSQTRVISN